MHLVCSIMICGFLLLAQNGCTLLAKSTYGVAVDERKVGAMAEDERIKLTIQRKLLGDEAVKIPRYLGILLRRPRISGR